MTFFESIATAKIHLLDCTLRDGGYYNSWFFGADIARNLAAADLSAGITYLELGFRTPVNDSYNGPFYFSDDNYLRSLELPSGITYLVMINLSDYLNPDGYLDKELIWKFFRPAVESPIHGVRIACRVEDLAQAKQASEILSSLGYLVMINLMQIHLLGEASLREFGKSFECQNIEALFLADSTGSENPQTVAEKIGFLRSEWSGRIGFHAHDNLGLALANADAAARSGAEIIDATVLGMGRGPGNLRLEELLVHRCEKGSLDAISSLIDLVESEFYPLMIKHRWGYSPLYVLSGLLGVHPTYAQEILRQRSISRFEGLKAIEIIGKEGKEKFNPRRIIDATEWYSAPISGEDYPTHLKERGILLLGPCELGPDLQAGLLSFVSNNDLVVVALNNSQPQLDNIIDTRFYSDPISIQRSMESFKKSKSKKVLPLSALPSKFRTQIEHTDNGKIMDFGLELSEGCFSLKYDRVIIEKSLAIHYALAILSGANLKALFIAAFDGYSLMDPRQADSSSAIKSFEELTGLEIKSVTPTNYDVKVISPFGPGS